uniref:60S ribosomal protein L36a n=1 Tax=Aegilops tauschii TaxID=37682 RepID=R7W2R5_AEGTA
MLEVVEVIGASTKVPTCRTQNYNQKEDIALRFIRDLRGCNDRNESNEDHVLGENYRPLQQFRGCAIKSYTSGVQVAEYGPYIQGLFKHRNTKFSHKPFTLHHCYKELCKNEKWIQKIAETTPKRSRLSISVKEDDEVDKMQTIDWKETSLQKKERNKRNAFGGTYKVELVAMIETKKMMAAERKEGKMARWNELKALEDEKWKAKSVAEERKLKVEERKLALEEERIRNAKKAEERAIMFMNPNIMDEIARKYWELTRGEILEASLRNAGGGRGGGGGDDVDGCGREDGGGDGDPEDGGVDFFADDVILLVVVEGVVVHAKDRGRGGGVWIERSRGAWHLVFHIQAPLLVLLVVLQLRWQGLARAWIAVSAGFPAAVKVNVPKTKKTYCKNKECKKHTLHKVTQYKKGKDSLSAQGKRRYDRKQSGYGGQTKPVFHKKAKTTKKIVLKLQCQSCKHYSQRAIKIHETSKNDLYGLEFVMGVLDLTRIVYVSGFTF